MSRDQKLKIKEIGEFTLFNWINKFDENSIIEGNIMLMFNVTEANELSSSFKNVKHMISNNNHGNFI